MTQGYPDPQVYDTTPKLLKYNAEQFPDDVALRQKNFGIWEEFTWAEFHQRVRHLSLAMQALGKLKCRSNACMTFARQAMPAPLVF